jgi:non-specific serine/threonine protein kinase
MPQGLAGRDATSRVVPLSPAHELPFACGLQAFIEEARTLARCDHPSLLRIVRLLETHGTAYSVMPHYVGRPLTDVRRDANAAYDEDQLRALLGDLLEALEAFHAFGRVHGGVSPDNVLLLQNGRPVLLRPRAQGQGTSGEPIDTLTGYLNARSEAASIGGASEAWTDIRDAARVIRFLMGSGWAGHHARAGNWEGSARDGVGAPSRIVPNARYSRSFLDALDAAESPLPERRPQSVGEFREWLKRASRSQTAVVGARRHDGGALAEDLSVRKSEGNTAPAALVFGAPELEPERGPAAEMTLGLHPPPRAEACSAAAASPLPTPPAAERPEGDPPTGPVDPEMPARAEPDRYERTRRIALKGAVLLGVLAVPAIAMWLLNQPPVAIRGWSKALVPPSLIPSRDAPKPDVTAVAKLPEAASQAPSPALESSGALAGTALDAAPMLGDLAARGAPITSPSNPASGNSGALAPTGHAAALSLPAAPEQPRSPVTAAHVLQASPKHGSPRELCTPRTQFALYRCMQTQCSTPKWSQHAQCIRLRSTDEVK